MSHMFSGMSLINIFVRTKELEVSCDNYRGISHLSIAGKILAQFILDRNIKHFVNGIYPESSSRFHAGRNTIDRNFSFR